MKRAVLVALVVALGATAFTALPAAAQSGWIAAGLGVVAGKASHGWAYGEVQVQDDFALAAEYVSPAFSLIGRFGGARGPYGQVGFGDGKLASWELGLWARTGLAGTVSAAGWIGLQGSFNSGSSVLVAVQGEVYFPISGRLLAVMGAETALGSATTVPVRAYLGLGTQF
ncbi:MAG TPA: hypothetical protein VIK98_06185 [Limnochordales bacterium]